MALQFVGEELFNSWGEFLVEMRDWGTVSRYPDIPMWRVDKPAAWRHELLFAVEIHQVGCDRASCRNAISERRSAW